MPPINDNLANAIILTGTSATVSGDNTNATLEALEIFYHRDDGTGDVWYKWVAEFTGTLAVTITAPTIGQECDIRTGTGYPDFGFVGGAFASAGTSVTVNISVTQGLNYFFQISYFSPDIGSPFTLAIAKVSVPANDNFTQAQSITSSFSLSGNNTLATVEIGEPSSHYFTMWYNFNSSFDGTLNLSVDSGMKFSIYLGDELNQLTPVTPINGSVYPIISFLNYKIVVYAQDSFSYGSFNFTGAFTAVTRPVNDLFASSIELTGDSFNVSGDNSLARLQLYEDPTNYFSLWYSYTPTENGALTLIAVSGIPLTFKVYGGASMQDATLVSSSNDSILLPVQDGITYSIAVCSQDASTYGAFTFSGTFQNDLPFQYASGTHGITPSFPQRCSVRESGGRIWIGSPRNGIGVGVLLSYSDNNGTTWTSANYADTSINDVGRQWTGLFFDSGENLIFGYTTGTFSNNFRVIKRDKAAGTFTVYNQSIQGGTGGSLTSYIPHVHADQDDSGYIHIIRNVLTNYSTTTGPGGVVVVEGAYNLYYFNFKDGTFSSEQQLTNYSGYTTGIGDYQDTVNPENIYDGGHGNHEQFPHIIWDGTQLNVFWSTRKYTYTGTSGGNNVGTTVRQLMYNVLTTGLDLVYSAHQWVTGRAYKVGYAVFETGSYYICNTAHTSTVFSTDAANWSIFSHPVSPTVFYQSSLSNNVPYTSSLATLFGVQAIRSNGTHLYFIFITNVKGTLTYYLYEDYVDITPKSGEWGDWMYPDYFDLATNDDLILYGYDNRIFAGRPTVVCRRSGEWKSEHTDSRNALVAGHTYNFAKIQ